jgi:hypothetical protein
VARYDEGCRWICSIVRHLSEGESWALETSETAATAENSRVEVERNQHGFYRHVVTYSVRVWFNMGNCWSSHQGTAFHSSQDCSWQSCIWSELFACMVFRREFYLIEVCSSPLSSRRNYMSRWMLGWISALLIIHKLTGKLNGQIKFWKTCSRPTLWSMGRAGIKAFRMRNSGTIIVIKLAWRYLRSKHCMADRVGRRCSR